MKLLFYCTKRRPPLIKSDGYLLNGKIVGECDYEIEEIFYNNIREDFGTNTIIKQEELFEKSCTDYCSLYEYLNIDDDNDNIGYAIYIKNLHIFNVPKKLSDYMSGNDKDLAAAKEFHNFFFSSYSQFAPRLTKAPKNMKIVSSDGYDKKVLIPVDSELMRKILYGECTIIVKKNILKGM